MLRNAVIRTANDPRQAVDAASVGVVVLGVASIVLGLAASLPAQTTGFHYQHRADMPPGAIGRLQLERGGPLHGYYQPVEIVAPAGVRVAPAEQGRFDEPVPTPINVGLLIGQVYRFKVSRIPLHEGLEVYPTVELIDRLYPPPGQKTRFPIPIELTREELVMALSGKLVTRVIYLEDPATALPIRQTEGRQPYYEVPSGQDPLEAADRRGRPMAILRLGSRVPGRSGPDIAFLFGSPPLARYPKAAAAQPLPTLPALPKQQPADTEDGESGRPEPAAPEGPDVPQPAPPAEDVPVEDVPVEQPEKLPAAENAAIGAPHGPSVSVRSPSIRFGK